MACIRAANIIITFQGHPPYGIFWQYNTRYNTSKHKKTPSMWYNSFVIWSCTKQSCQKCLPLHDGRQGNQFTQEICSMLVHPVLWPVARYCSAASTASLPMDTLSAPDLKYSAATSSALQNLPLASVNSRMPPPTVSGTKTPLDACLSTCPERTAPSGCWQLGRSLTYVQACTPHVGTPGTPIKVNSWTSCALLAKGQSACEMPCGCQAMQSSQLTHAAVQVYTRLGRIKALSYSAQQHDDPTPCGA